jgi:acyl carrier protein
MSNENAVKEKIKGIIASRLKDQQKIRTLEYDTPLLSLGIDSILALSILVEMEDEFNVEIDDSDLNMDKIRNINSFAELIESYIS